MVGYLITFRSVTPAQRGESLLKKHGMDCTVRRTPRWMEEKGCGYCLRLRMADVKPAVQLLRSAQVPYQRVYVQNANADVEEVRL